MIIPCMVTADSGLCCCCVGPLPNTQLLLKGLDAEEVRHASFYITECFTFADSAITLQ